MDLTARRPASFDNLPTELLTKIFQLVRDETVAELHRTPSDDPYDKKWFQRPEFVRPSTRFPDALMQVSAHWRNAISLVPEFHNTLVYAIDISKPIPIAIIQSHLEASTNVDLPLDILVTRRPGSARPDSGDTERSILAPLVQLFLPHLYRCRTFSFYAIHSSALPQLGRHLSGTLPHLVTLRLECEVDDGGPIQSSIPWKEAICPALDTLTLDGHNFITMTSMNREWPGQFPSLKSLSLVRLKPLPDIAAQNRRICLYDFLDLISAGSSLRLSYLRFCDAELTNPASEEYAIAPSLEKAFILEDLSPTFVYELVVAVRPQTPEIHITRCSLNAIGRIPTSPALRLEDIGEYDQLSNHLKHWSGTSLELVRCVGANDDFLDMLGAVSEFTGAPQLDKLTLRDCENWTVAALRKMVEKRNKNVPQSAGGQQPWPGKPAISEIVVCGKGPAVDAADVDWLRERMRVVVVEERSM